jgi:predicted nucleotidyltransferase
MDKLIEINIDKIKQLCSNYKVKNLYLFGSALRRDFNNSSDIDLLLSFLDGISIKEYTDNFFELHYKLEEIFGRQIDLITERSLSNKFFIDEVNNSKQLIYENQN